MQDWPDRPRDLTRWILNERPAKNTLHANRAYGAFVEKEPDANGRLIDVATLLLTNRECPFCCLMCDLWRNTLDDPTPVGAVPNQIRSALSQLPPAQTIKLYNAGNFFDTKAIPSADWYRIAELVAHFERVIVQSHPKLISDRTLEFRDALAGRLEVAVGLETVHEGVLERLNKQMTLDDFEQSVHFLRGHEIDVRSFILLRPPFMGQAEGVEWAKRSIDFAFSIGVQCCSVVPTRAGNGAMDRLQARGLFQPPDLCSMEEVLEYGLELNRRRSRLDPLRGRVFIDLWDIEKFYQCGHCSPARAERLRRMNLTQTILPRITCECRASTCLRGRSADSTEFIF